MIEVCAFNQTGQRGTLMSKITTVGVDLAKEVIVVCGADAAGHVAFRKQLTFAGFAAWAANLPPCVVGMEACSSAHHWARHLVQHGHDARLMLDPHTPVIWMSAVMGNGKHLHFIIDCPVDDRKRET
jgi:hypothetical protein